MRNPGGVHQEAVVGGELLVAAVQTGVVEIGAQDAARKVVTDNSAGHALKEGKGRHVGLHEGGQRHAQDRVAEEVTAVGEHHDKGPYPLAFAGPGVEPLAQVLIINLGLLPRRGIVLGYGHLGERRLGGKLQTHVASE